MSDTPSVKRYTDDTIVLVGIKHAGKSSVGMLAARMLGVPFVDVDDTIVRLANEASENSRQYSTARDVYGNVGERAFRVLEAFAVEQLPKRCVAAAGGGLADCARAWNILRGAYIVLLDVSAKTAWQRVRDVSPHEAHIPAFVKNAPNPYAVFVTLAHRRAKIYREHARVTYNTEEYTPEQVAHMILFDMHKQPKHNSSASPHIMLR